MATTAPTVAHREWRFLLRDFVRAFPAFQPVTSKVLQLGLAPAASVARWLASDQPALLERPELAILVPGASTPESRDDGAWFAFIPWLAGKPGLKVSVILVGLPSSQANTFGDEGLPIRTQRTQVDQIAKYPKATIFRGSVGQWRQANPEVAVDASVLFSPGFSTHADTWFAPGELVPFMTGTPLGLFSYSRMDALEDREALKLLGFQFTARELPLNPWHIPHEHIEIWGSYAHYAWCLSQVIAPETIDPQNPAMREWLSLHDYMQEAVMEAGPDQILGQLGKAFAVSRANDAAATDEIYILPYDTGVLKSSGLVGSLDEHGFLPLDPPVHVPAEHLAAKPDDSDEMARISWAIRLHRDVVAPMVNEAEEGPHEFLNEIGTLDEASMAEWFKDFAKKATGREIDYEDFMRQVRLNGGAHGQTHPRWHDLLETLGWAPHDYDDEPERFDPAFYVTGKRHAPEGLPVICEAYPYLPDDEGDELAHEAMETVADWYPDGALLLFKGMPYKEIQGHKYCFGGLLFWDDAWHVFAMNQTMTSVDDVIEQIMSGFSFENVNPQYADDGTAVAIPFNRMCYGADPNEPISMMGLTTGTGWVTLMPAEKGLLPAKG